MRNLLRLYGMCPDFYILVRPGAVVVVETPEGQTKLIPTLLGDNPPTQCLLRVFMSSGEAEKYRELTELQDASIVKASLEGVWRFLNKLDELTKKQGGMPIRIEVGAFEKGRLVYVDVLRAIGSTEEFNRWPWSVAVS